MKLFNGILILVENAAFCRDRAYELPLVGKPMHEWVRPSLGDTVFSLPLNDQTDFIDAVRAHLDADAKYTVVLYSDTPLIKKQTVAEALRTIAKSQKPVLRLTRGWVFETAYLEGLRECPQDARRMYLSEEEDFMTCRDFESTALVTEILRRRILSYHMANGVHIVDPASTYIDGDVVIDSGVRVAPFNCLRGRTVLGKNVMLEESNVIEDSIIADGSTITESRIKSCYVGESCVIGPKAYLREDCVIGCGCRVGDYVELKKTKLGDQTKVAHLSYLGDCETGTGCNIGGGVITANYDGTRKYRTVLGDHVFVGSNSTLVAPINLGNDSFIAAGSTVTDEVPEKALTIARARQNNLAGRTKW